jgi:CheY-like chemotaxis protein
MERKKILIVDDELDMRIYLSTLLATSGYQPVAVRDGGEGLRRAEEIAPSLIILDVMMPGDGGAQTYRRLRTEARFREIPVIMLSAVPGGVFDHYLKMLAAATGEPVAAPQAYLEKPLEHEALLGIVRRLLA